MTKTKSSQLWLQRKTKDVYQKLAKKNQLLSRAAFKLQEIDKKFQLINKSTNILDIGCYPGSWLQYLRQYSAPYSSIIGIDIKNTPKINGIITIQGNFINRITQKKITNKTNQFCDLICSDMCAQATGNKLIDHLKSIDLLNNILAFTYQYHKPQANLILKMLQGKYSLDFIKKLKHFYIKVSIFKPHSSYKNSREVFIIARN